MIIFPALDLKEGKCVRLFKGDMTFATIFNDNPIEQANQFQLDGFKYIHVVDLDGAVLGKSQNYKIVSEIVKKCKLKIQLGGGIRSIEDIDRWISQGVSRVILGTLAVENSNLVVEACKKYPNQILVSIDARNFNVSTDGWVKDTKINVIELAKKFVNTDIAGIIYTDINRDGALKGCDFDGVKKLANAVKIPIIASGGISSIKDIDKIASLEAEGVVGVIVGKAWYQKKISIEEIRKYL